MNLRPEMRGADKGQEEHQLFIAFWAEQPAQLPQPRRGMTRVEDHHGARDAKAAAQIGVEVGPIAERRARFFQRCEVFWQFLFGRNRLIEQRQRLLRGDALPEQERAMADHPIARFAEAREPGEEPPLEAHGHRVVEVGELGLPKQVSGNRRLGLRKLEERGADSEARLNLIPELIDRRLRVVFPSGWYIFSWFFNHKSPFSQVFGSAIQYRRASHPPRCLSTSHAHAPPPPHPPPP